MTPCEIAALRAKMQLSQTALAALLGVNYHTVGLWEKGIQTPRPISMRMLEALAAGQMTPYGWVFQGGEK